ncbi:MAG: nitroreductase [Desulfomonile tiedjei]|uniref:Nitroreductase n=1 Tax=Desulfomonile tiedjei TaxID=2358 RepID=A0A9D6Z7Z6_9BACT|nr:nitroreductase [Desulfomonile tiedjei]
MDLIEAIRTRRSVRAFLDEPISTETLEQVLADAGRAPSAINMQPWEIHMVLGEERKRLSRRLLRSFKENALTCGPGTTKPVPEKFMIRARECADQMLPLIQKMGADFKAYVNEGSLDFYGAPAVALIFVDDCFPPDRMVDAGSFLGYLVLAASAHGLASCPIGLVRSYQDEIKDHLNVPETKNLAISVALGKPDLTAPINEFRSARAELREFVRWID